MSNPNGKKGSAFERSIADCLAEHLHDDRIDRRVKSGAKDKGDIANVRCLKRVGITLGNGKTIPATTGRVVVECKNTKTLALSGWVNEAEIERGNDDALIGVVVHKRRGVADPLEQYVTCTVRDLIALLTGERPDR